MLNLSTCAWLPDQISHRHDGLTKASGVIPIGNGYVPIGQLQPVTTALADFAGGAAYIAADGTSSLLAGGATALHRWSGTAWVSQFATPGAGKWQFGQFGDFAIGVYGGAPVKYNLATGVAALLGGSPPNAKYITIGGNFVVVAGSVAANSTVSWSGFNAAETWTSGSNQSDDQQLPDGGKITGLAGHENYFLTFQRDAINRFTYVGAPAVFQRDKISTGVGCISPGTIQQAGEMTFFLSERGFMLTDGNSVTPIGNEQVDRSFFNSFSRAELHNVSAAVDPRQHLYFVTCPGSPGRMWIYNWALQRWSNATLNIKAVFPAFTSNIGLDALDALYPGGIDSIPVSLDSPLFQGGEPRLYAVDVAGFVGAFSGENMEAVVEWPFQDVGIRARPFMARPITDAIADVTLTIDARARLGDGTANVVSSDLRASGHIPVRCNGRYLLPSLAFAAGARWTNVQGLEIEFGTGGRR